jgi:hypothetical protein
MGEGSSMLNGNEQSHTFTAERIGLMLEVEVAFAGPVCSTGEGVDSLYGRVGEESWMLIGIQADALRRMVPEGNPEEVFAHSQTFEVSKRSVGKFMGEVRVSANSGIELMDAGAHILALLGKMVAIGRQILEEAAARQAKAGPETSIIPRIGEGFGDVTAPPIATARPSASGWAAPGRHMSSMSRAAESNI